MCMVFMMHIVHHQNPAHHHHEFMTIHMWHTIASLTGNLRQLVQTC